MVLEFKVESPWHCGAAHRCLDQPEDLSLYDALSFYVHGPQDVQSLMLSAIVRMGTDSLNFYEYGVTVVPAWIRAKVDLSDLRRVEGHLPQERTIYGSTVSFRGGETPSGWIWVYGEPDLSRISWIGVGLVNGPAPAPGLTRLEVWIDDIRATATLD
jgi:cell surface protein SprA